MIGGNAKQIQKSAAEKMKKMKKPDDLKSFQYFTNYYIN